MALYDRVDFNPTPVRTDGSVVAAGRAEMAATSEFGQSLTQRGKKMQAQDDQNFLNKARVDLRSTRDRLLNEFATDQDGFNSAWDSHITETYKAVPGQVFDNFELMAYESKTQVNDTITKNLQTIADNQNNAAEIESNQILFDDMDRDAESGDYINATNNRDELIANLNYKIDNGLIDGAGYAKQKAFIDAQFDIETNRGIINRFIADNDLEGLNEYIADLSNPEKKLSSFIGRGEGFSFDDGNKNVSESTRAKILNAAVQQRKAYQTGQKAVDKVAKDNAKEILAGYQKRLNDGGILSPEDLTSYIEQVTLIGDPVVLDDAKQFVQVYNYLNTNAVDAEGNETVAFGNLTLRGMELRINQMKSEPLLAGNKLLIDSAEAMYESAKKGDINYGVTRGWYENPPLIFDETLSDQLMVRKENQAIFNQKMGIGSNVTLFTQEEISGIIKNIEDNPPILKEFVEGLGAQTPSVLAEIGVKNPIIGVAGNLYLDGKLELGDSLFTGQSILEDMKEDPAYKLITEQAQIEISGAYGLNSEHEKAVRDAAMARAAYLAKLDGFPLNEKNFKEYYLQGIKDVAPPIVHLDSDKLNQYKITSPNPNWTQEEAQDKTEEWIGGLTIEDFPGVEKDLAEKIIGDIDTIGDYGFPEYKLVPFKGGYLLRQTFPPGFVKNEDGTDFVLRYTEKNKIPGDTTVEEIPVVVDGDSVIVPGIGDANAADVTDTGEVYDPKIVTGDSDLITIIPNVEVEVVEKADEEAIEDNNTVIIDNTGDNEGDTTLTTYVVVDGSTDDLILREDGNVVTEEVNDDGTITYVVENKPAAETIVVNDGLSDIPVVPKVEENKVTVQNIIDSEENTDDFGNLLDTNFAGDETHFIDAQIRENQMNRNEGIQFDAEDDVWKGLSVAKKKKGLQISYDVEKALEDDTYDREKHVSSVQEMVTKLEERHKTYKGRNIRETNQGKSAIKVQLDAYKKLEGWLTKEWKPEDDIPLEDITPVLDVLGYKTKFIGPFIRRFYNVIMAEEYDTPKSPVNLKPEPSRNDFPKGRRGTREYEKARKAWSSK